MSNDASDVLDHHPVTSELDVVNTSKGPMTRKDYNEWRSANPKAAPTGVAALREIQNLRKRGDLTESQYQALYVNQMRGEGEPEVPVPSFEQAQTQEKERSEYNEYAAKHDSLLDMIDDAFANARAGRRVNPNIQNRLDDALMQTFHTSERLGFGDMSAHNASLIELVEDAKLKLQQAKVMNRLAR